MLPPNGDGRPSAEGSNRQRSIARAIDVPRPPYVCEVEFATRSNATAPLLISGVERPSPELGSLLL